MSRTRLQQREGRSLGSPLRLTVAGTVAPALVDAAWAEAVDEFAAVDRAMSRFRPDSELHALHANGSRASRVSRRLRVALVAADRARRVTDGRFDPRVVRALERIGAAGLTQPWSGEAELSDPGPGTPVVRRASRGDPLALPAPVDLGGIGKGLALRWAGSRVAKVLGRIPGAASGYLVEAGGDVAAAGSVGDASWSIRIEDPGGAPDPVAAVRLPDGLAIATSSVRLNRWVAPDGRAAHHLIDPRTGAPALGGLLSVTVAFPDPAWGEIWSKALFVEGGAGIAELARRRGLAAWWVTDAGDLAMTPAARAMTFWVRSEAARAARSGAA